MEKVCKYCLNLIKYDKPYQLGTHIRHCIKNPNKLEIIQKIAKSKRLERLEYNLNCLKCNKDYKVILTEPDFRKGYYKKHCSRKCSNSHKPLSKEAKLSIRNKLLKKNRRICKHIECNKQIRDKNKSGYCKKHWYSSEEHKFQLSNNKGNKSGKRGGFRENGGRSYHGYYKGILCQSSWELAFLIYCFDNDIKIKRNKIGFNYIYKNKIKKYYPDFIIDNTYIEIKGFITEDWPEKQKQFKENLYVYDSIKMKPILKTIINKYGKNFVKKFDILLKTPNNRNK